MLANYNKKRLIIALIIFGAIGTGFGGLLVWHNNFQKQFVQSTEVTNIRFEHNGSKRYLYYDYEVNGQQYTSLHRESAVIESLEDWRVCYHPDYPKNSLLIPVNNSCGAIQ